MKTFRLLLLGLSLHGAVAAAGHIPAENVKGAVPGTPESRVVGNGLRAEYYNGIHFEQKVLTRIDPEINFSLFYQPVAPGVNAERFSVRWTGRLLAPASGVYRFIVRVDDGVRLWVGNRLLLDEWHLQQEEQYVRAVKLEANRYYDLKIEYFNDPRHAVMQLYWETPTDRTPVVVSRDNLFSGPFAPRAVPVKARSVTPEIRQPAPLVRKEPVPARRSEPLKPREEAPIEKPVEKPVAEPVKEDLFELLPGAVLVLQNVHFEQSRYVLLPESYPELEKLAKTLLKFPRVRLEIAGHTDNQGDPRLNQALSEHRAQVVVNYLIRRGVEAARLTAIGYGSNRPLTDNATETARARNRRVECRVLNQE